MTEHHPPGEPHAVEIERQLADLVVVDGPNAGQVWTYEADHGGYLPADPAQRAEDDVPLADVGAVLAHTGAEVVRPVEEER